MCKIMVSTDAHWCTKISYYVQWIPTSFHQHCGHLQGYKTQGLDISEVYNEHMKI
jgi:hypothetical protein